MKKATKKSAAQEKKPQEKSTAAKEVGKKPLVPILTIPEREAALKYFQHVRRFPELERNYAETVWKKYKAQIEKIRGVLWTDVGVKVSGDRNSGIYAICVYVTDKFERDKNGETILPPGATKADVVRDCYEGVPTDIINGGIFKNAGPFGGDLVFAADAVQSSFPGTLGVGVIDINTGDERYLTCAHVLSFPGENNQILSQRDVIAGATIGSIQGGVIQEDWRFDSIVDCAVIKPTSPRSFEFVPVRGIPLEQQPSTIRLPRHDDEIDGNVVWTRGAKTNAVTEGQIFNISGRPEIKHDNGSTTACEQQIMVRSLPLKTVFAQKGDSGSVVCRGREALGIVRAVNDDGVVVVAPFKTLTGKNGIADHLKIQLSGGDPVPRP